MNILIDVKVHLLGTELYLKAEGVRVWTTEEDKWAYETGSYRRLAKIMALAGHVTCGSGQMYTKF